MAFKKRVEGLSPSEFKGERYKSEVERLFGRDFGLTKDEIKRLDVSTIEGVKTKVGLMADYLLTKKLQGDVLSKYGGPGDVLIGELGELMVLQSLRREKLKEEGKSLLEDPCFMDNQDRIIKLLIDLKKLGIDERRVSMLEQSSGFTVESVDGEVVQEEQKDSGEKDG